MKRPLTPVQIPRAQMLTLCAVFAVLALLHARNDCLACAALMGGAAAWRGLDAWRGPDAWTGNIRPRGWLVLLFAMAGIGLLINMGAAEGYNTLAIRALVVLAGLKLLETRTPRDITVLVFLGFFLVATVFLFDQGIATSLLGFAMVWIMLSVLRAANAQARPGDWRRHASAGALLMVLAVPVALLLFFVFPRLQGPLWHLGFDERAGITGLGDSMEPGGISRLVLSGEIAFRADFGSAPMPPRESLYWRGPVLWNTDGRRWTRRQEDSAPAPVLNIRGTRTDYRLILEPQGQRWILALDVPAGAPSGATISADGETMAAEPLYERSTQWLHAFPQGQFAGLSDAQQQAGLQLPPEVGPRTRALAAQLRRAGTSDAGIVAATLDHFRHDGFGYTLQPPLMGADPVESFLFEHRVGFCEHYAGAFTTLLRLAGIPARVVTGYLGGEVNPNNGQLLVRQSDAHAWAEVWLDGAWVRVDPTASVAPDRVELGIDVPDAMARGGFPLFGTEPDFIRHLARRAQWLWDAVEMAWYADFVNFNDQRQRSLLERAGLQALGTTGMALVLAAAVILAMGITAAWALTGRRARIAPEARLYARYCRKLKRLGLIRRKDEGPLEFAARVRSLLAPEPAALSDAITTHYVALRYGREPAEADLRSLAKAVAALRPRLDPAPRTQDGSPSIMAHQRHG